MLQVMMKSVSSGLKMKKRSRPEAEAEATPGPEQAEAAAATAAAGSASSDLQDPDQASEAMDEVGGVVALMSSHRSLCRLMLRSS